jgi:phytoene dehydrogenase-like protein
MSSKHYRSISRRDFLKLAAATTAVLAVDCTRLEVLASEIEPKEELPVVVIGGGLGGLSAAAIFARNGFPVSLVEQHDRPGGYATSFDRAAGKFTFDVSLHATGDVSGGPMRRVFEKAGILHKIEMVDLPELCRIITPDHDLVWPQRDPEAIVDQLCQTFPGYSEPGTSTVTVMMLSGYEPWRRFETDYLAGRKEAYLKEKERITEELIEQAEKLVIPRLRSMIEVKEAATPLTNLHYTRNPEGAIYGYEQSLDNSFMNRIKNTTPFRGLYLASAWGGAGGGYQPCLESGLKAFKAVIEGWGGRA